MSLIHFSFDTTAFRDSEEILNENINRIHGFELAMWLYRELTELGFDATDAIDEDFGWYFFVNCTDCTYFCTTSIDVDDQPSTEVHVSVSKKRSLLDYIRGRNKMSTDDDVVAEAVARILTASPYVNGLQRHYE